LLAAGRFRSELRAIADLLAALRATATASR
jgi:hypothetical protein